MLMSPRTTTAVIAAWTDHRVRPAVTTAAPTTTSGHRILSGSRRVAGRSPKALVPMPASLALALVPATDRALVAGADVAAVRVVVEGQHALARPLAHGPNA